MTDKLSLRKGEKTKMAKTNIKNESSSIGMSKIMMKNKRLSKKNSTVVVPKVQATTDLPMSRYKSEIETRLEKDSSQLSNVDLDSVDEQKDGTISKMWGEPDSDDDYEMLREFDVNKAWKNLLSIPNCMKIPLSLEAQKKLEIEVGKNVSNQHPWKQIQLKNLIKLFDDDLEMENLKRAFGVEDLGELYERFTNISADDLILVGYWPIVEESVDDENDYFIFYGSHASARKAGSIIENIERYEDWLLNKTLFKKTRTWISKGSELEVDLFKSKEHEQIIDVEFQSVYPIYRKKIQLSERLSSDVRDGYVELVPGDKQFKNIFRRRVDIGIQSSEKKIDLEQQTDPTFPSNAWSQYTYEIDQSEHLLDKSDIENEDDKTKEKDDTKSSSKDPSPNAVTPIPNVPELSKKFQYLIDTIEFNQIHMYRNDYAHISSIPVKKYKVPILEEVLSFSNISKSSNRMVCAVDWYPVLSGILVASYTFSNLVTSISAKEDVDMIKTTILEQNPVLMWNFSDSLQFKLEFEAPREVTALSFCPFDENLLLGGTINGTLIIWDLQNRLDKLDKYEILTSKQFDYHTMIQEHLLWTKQIDENTIIHPAAVSSLQGNQNGPITSIKWLDRTCTISQTGHIRKTDPGTSKYFLTISIDGSIAFWHIESDIEFKKTTSDIITPPLGVTSPLHQHHRHNNNRNYPPQLIKNTSIYKKYDRQIKPIFIIEIPEPITDILIDSAKFHYEPYDIHTYSTKMLKNIHTKIPIQVTSINREEIKQILFMSSLYGHMIMGNWEGLSHSGVDISKEKVYTIKQFAIIHDGPILGAECNPFIEEVFFTFGGTIFAIWEISITEKPIIWRQIHTRITQMRWSLDRAGVVYLTTMDGTFQIWDLLSRSETPSLNTLIGGGSISSLSQQVLLIPRKVVSIGEYNSCLKIYYVPSEFYTPVPNEIQIGTALIERTRRRQYNASSWQKSWLQNNADVIMAKRAEKEEQRKELERLQREIQEAAAQKLRREEDEKRKASEKQSKKKTYDLPQILQKRWDEFNLKRIMEILMKRRRLDPIKLKKETALEKERLNYIKKKKDAIKTSYQLIDNDYSEIRSKLLPLQKFDLRRSDLIYELTMNIINNHNNIESYKDIELNMNFYIEEHPSVTDISFYDFHSNGRHRRDILNQSLNEFMNNKRRQYYEKMKLDGVLSQCNFGKSLFISNEIVSLQQQKQQLNQQQNDDDVLENDEDENVKINGEQRGESKNLANNFGTDVEENIVTQEIREEREKDHDYNSEYHQIERVLKEK